MAENTSPKTIKWRALLTESALLCASILLAFWLDDWGEQQDIERRTQTALCNVKSELAFNRTLLKDDYLPRHKALLEYVETTLATLRQKPSPEQSYALIDRPIYNDGLRYSTWKLATESGYLLHADFKLAAEIGALYDLQEDSYKQNALRIIEVLFEDTEGWHNATVSSQTRLKALFTEWLAQGEYLIYKYDTLFALPAFKALQCEQDTAS